MVRNCMPANSLRAAAHSMPAIGRPIGPVLLHKTCTRKHCNARKYTPLHCTGSTNYALNNPLA
eukprot:2573-Alexandrium_andersonii.AAC.1